MVFRCKIREEDVTTTLSAVELIDLGYRKVSSAYCRVARIDRDDWLVPLAQQRKCSIAEFYSLDGSGIPDCHRDTYVRMFSQDILTVPPSIIRQIPTY